MKSTTACDDQFTAHPDDASQCVFKPGQVWRSRDGELWRVVDVQESLYYPVFVETLNGGRINTLLENGTVFDGQKYSGNDLVNQVQADRFEPRTSRLNSNPVFWFVAIVAFWFVMVLILGAL